MSHLPSESGDGQQRQPPPPPPSNTGGTQGLVGPIRTHRQRPRQPGVVGRSRPQSRREDGANGVVRPPIPNVDEAGGTLQGAANGHVVYSSTHAYDPYPYPHPPSLPHGHPYRHGGSNHPPAAEHFGTGTACFSLHNVARWAQQQFSPAPSFHNGVTFRHPHPTHGFVGHIQDVPHHHDYTNRPSSYSLSSVNSPMLDMTFLGNGYDAAAIGESAATITSLDGSDNAAAGSSRAHDTSPVSNGANGDSFDWAPFGERWLALAARDRKAQVEVAVYVDVDVDAHPEQVQGGYVTEDEFVEGSSRDLDHSQPNGHWSVSGTMVGDERVVNPATMRHMAPAFFANALGLEIPAPVPPIAPVVQTHAYTSRGPHPSECPTCGRVPDHTVIGEWRTGVVSLKMVCNACGQYEARTRRVRPKNLEQRRRKGNGKRDYAKSSKRKTTD